MHKPQSTTRAAVAGALLLSLTLVPTTLLAAPTQVKRALKVDHLARAQPPRSRSTG